MYKICRGIYSEFPRWWLQGVPMQAELEDTKVSTFYLKLSKVTSQFWIVCQLCIMALHTIVELILLLRRSKVAVICYLVCNNLAFLEIQGYKHELKFNRGFDYITRQKAFFLQLCQLGYESYPYSLTCEKKIIFVFL